MHNPDKARLQDGAHTAEDPTGISIGTSAILGEYIASTELADELGICERTLARWHRARIGPPRVAIGRRILYRRAAVAEWLRKRERGFDEKPPRRRAARRW
jgi:hypothetical protein